MKLHKTNENEIYFYYLKNDEKRFLYRHKYADALGKRKEKKKSGFKTKKEALRSLLEVKASILNEGSSNIENDQMTVTQWMDIWFETYNNSWEVSSRNQRKQVINQYIKPMIGKQKITKLDRATYTRLYINELLKTLKPNTAQLYHRIFCIAINAAVDNEVIPRNRFSNIPFEQGKKLDNFLTPDELNIFLSQSKKLKITRHTLILLLAYTGIRRGELLGLTWKDVDFFENTITINGTRDHHGYRKPKTLNSYRTITVDERLIEQLKKYQKWCIQVNFMYGEQLDKENDYILITDENEPCSQEEIRLTFKAVYKELEKEGINLKRITPHGLRHTNSTMLINNGIPPQTVANRLGNSVEMIYKVYSHSIKDLEDKAVSIISENIGAKSGAD